MDNQRRNIRVFDAASMAASTVVANALPIVLGRDGYLSLQVLIDNGAGGAPSDAPLGVFNLYPTAFPGNIYVARFTRLVSDGLVTELAKIAPNGNLVVDAWANVVGVPGTQVKVIYTRTSGGGGNSRMTVDACTW